MIPDHAPMIHYERQNNQCIYKYVSLFYFEHRILLRVSTTFCVVFFREGVP
jgi:hypothetical protein